MSEDKREKKIAMVKKHLEEVGHITGIEALRYYDCYRLSDVIYKLKKRGMDIVTEQANGNGYATYWLKGEQND